MTVRTMGLAAGCAVVLFAAGWCTGRSATATIAVQWSNASMRADVAEVRAALLATQLSVADANYGDARRALEQGRAVAERLHARLRETGQADRAGGLVTVLAQIDDAARLSAALDPNASGAAAEALRQLESTVPVTAP